MSLGYRDGEAMDCEKIPAPVSVTVNVPQLACSQTVRKIINLHLRSQSNVLFN